MTYNNPVFIFKPFLEVGKSLADQLSKKLLSEVEFSAKGFIEINDQAFTNNDVLSYLNCLKLTDSLSKN